MLVGPKGPPRCILRLQFFTGAKQKQGSNAIFLAIVIYYMSQSNKSFIKLEDKRPIWRFLLAFAEGPSGPLDKIVTNKVLMIRQNRHGQGANEALIVRFHNLSHK